MDNTVVESTIPIAKPNEDPRQCWSTPPEFLNWVKEYFGVEFDLDACGNHDNAKAPVYFGAPGYKPPNNSARTWAGENGLEHPWKLDGVSRPHVWCNPGYADVEPWLAKAAHEAKLNNAHTLVLTHASHTPEWFDNWFQVAHRVWAIRPRINFVMPPGVAKASSNPKDPYLWEFRRDAKPSDAIHVPPFWRPVKWLNAVA